MLRKELESLVENEGSEVLALPELPAAHPQEKIGRRRCCEEAPDTWHRAGL